MSDVVGRLGLHPLRPGNCQLLRDDVFGHVPLQHPPHRADAEVQARASQCLGDLLLPEGRARRIEALDQVHDEVREAADRRPRPNEASFLVHPAHYGERQPIAGCLFHAYACDRTRTMLVSAPEEDHGGIGRCLVRPRMKSIHWLACVLWLSTTGCAGMTVTPVPDDPADEQALGFRYYEESPYILVYSDGGGGLVSDLVYLPDLTRKMSARPYQFLASNTTKLVFSNGVLTHSVSEPDSSVVPKAVVEAAKSVALALVKKDALDEATAAKDPSQGGPLEIPLPRLFKLVVEGKDTKLLSASVVGSDGQPAVIRVDVPAAGGAR